LAGFDIYIEDMGMEKSRKILPGKKSQLPERGKDKLVQEAVHDDEVNKLLEHISSPYRWELLEVPVVKPQISIAKKPVNQKAR
jgi:hypothetical protein